MAAAHDPSKPIREKTVTPAPLARPRPFLVSSTRSPLASPQTPVHRLAVALQGLLYFPEPAPLYVVCGALAANMARGYPVWLMLIGPPESGKTELIKPLMQFAGCRECGDMSGKAALISATREKDRTAGATGGLLYDMPREDDGITRRGMLVMLDFARTVLAADPAAMRSTLGAIGMIHDQHYQREVGTDGGRTISFYGRVGFLAATTDVIDHPDHQQANAEMGERCLYYRYPESSGYHEINSSLDTPDGSAKSQEIRRLFGVFGAEIGGVVWHGQTPPRPLEDHERKTIGALAQFCARGRSGVQRDRWDKHQIAGLSRSALGPRLANTLAQLMRGMESVGCTPAEQRRVLMQCAMDSMPAVRAVAVKTIAQEGAVTPGELAAKTKISAAAAKRALEDLRMHGLTVSDQGDGNGRWTLSAVAEGLLRTGWEDEVK